MVGNEGATTGRTYAASPALPSEALWRPAVAYLLLAFAALGYAAVLTATAAAVGVGTLPTLLPDLVTSPLRALGVIDEAAWEASITEHSGWFVFTWVFLAAYLVLFLVVFPLAVRHSTGLRGPAAVLTGVLAFGVLQGAEYLVLR